MSVPPGRADATIGSEFCYDGVVSQTRLSELERETTLTFCKSCEYNIIVNKIKAGL